MTLLFRGRHTHTYSWWLFSGIVSMVTPLFICLLKCILFVCLFLKSVYWDTNVNKREKERGETVETFVELRVLDLRNVGIFVCCILAEVLRSVGVFTLHFPSTIINPPWCAPGSFCRSTVQTFSIPEKMRVSFLGFVLVAALPGALRGRSIPVSSADVHLLLLTGFLALSAQTAACAPPVLSGGYFFMKQESYPDGASISYSCDTGRKPVVKLWWATVTCENGKWSHEPQCIGKYSVTSHWASVNLFLSRWDKKKLK